MIYIFSKEIFAERLKQERLNKNLTQDNLANALGVTKTQISDMERGRRAISVEKLVLVSKYLNISADYLLGLSDNPKVNR